MMRRKGNPWLAASLALCVVLPVVVGMAMKTRHSEGQDRLRQEIHRLQAEEFSTRTSGGLAQSRERIEAFQKRLGGHNALSSRLDRLHQIAAGYGVKIGKAGYQVRPADQASGGIGRYEIRLEAEGAYYEFRFFLRDLLAADQLLALEALELRRPASGSYNTGGKTVVAVMHLVMYFGVVD